LKEQTAWTIGLDQDVIDWGFRFKAEGEHQFVAELKALINLAGGHSGDSKESAQGTLKRDSSRRGASATSREQFVAR